MDKTTTPSLRRVGIIFAGGPAPAANAVISAASISFLDAGIEVVGIFHGFSNLQDYDAAEHPMIEGKHVRRLDLKDVRGIRNQRGILIGTARANPGKGVQSRADLHDPAKTDRLRRVVEALQSLGIEALVTIGGDDTLRTANLLALWQQAHHIAQPVRLAHVPKTIDNDYRGIDFTFGFFTAVDFMAKEIQNLRADASATSSWFVVETMGRKAGWLSYGVAIAGEADLVLAGEDIDDSLRMDRETRTSEGERPLDLNALAHRVVDLMIEREQRDDQHFGVVVLAEGLAELLPESRLGEVTRDDHGHISLGRLDLGRWVQAEVRKVYQQRTGTDKKVTSVQLGYESRSAPAHAFDVMLGSQLGIGAYRALVEEGLDAHMVTVTGQLDLGYVPFEELVNATTLKTEVRFIKTGSDFHRLARFLESNTRSGERWSPGKRREP